MCSLFKQNGMGVMQLTHQPHSQAREQAAHAIRKLSGLTSSCLTSARCV